MAGEPPAGPPVWRERADRAVATIAASGPGAVIENQLATVNRSLAEAEGDQARLRAALGDLDPRRVSADLKAALRAPDAEAGLVASLRRRHETVNDLLNRLDRLDQQIEATVADLETLALRTGTIGARAGDDGPRREVERLTEDVEALAAAHREIERL